MQQKYLAASPYNLVRVILGERSASDSDKDNVYTRAAKHLDNVYTRAAKHLDDWIGEGVLSQDAKPGFYAYFQEFDVPDTGERATRMGFIGLGKVEDYSTNVVYRHEQTLSGPKKDRLELLRHARGHFGQIFMLYPDREGAVDRVLMRATQSAPAMDILDDYQARHRL